MKSDETELVSDTKKILTLFLGLPIFMLCIGCFVMIIAPLFWYFSSDIDFTWDRWLSLFLSSITLFGCIGGFIGALLLFIYFSSRHDAIKYSRSEIGLYRHKKKLKTLCWDEVSTISRQKENLVLTYSDFSKTFTLLEIKKVDVQKIIDAWFQYRDQND